jgi:hypothetical protein
MTQRKNIRERNMWRKSIQKNGRTRGNSKKRDSTDLLVEGARRVHSVGLTAARASPTRLWGSAASMSCHAMSKSSSDLLVILHIFGGKEERLAHNHVRQNIFKMQYLTSVTVI